MKYYNELFELAKDLHYEAKSDKDVKSLELIERLFPQLKETEEEKTLADLKKLVCARADSRDVKRFTKFLSRVTPVFTDKEESFCEHILPRIVNNPFEWSSEQGRADREYLKEFIDGIKGRFVAKAEEDNDNEVSATNDKILSTMLSHFKAKTKSEWCGLPVRDIIAWLEKMKEASKAIEAVERIDKYIDENVANAHDMKDSNPDKKYYRGWDDALGAMAEILQDVYSDKKQKEQKTDVDKYMEGYTNDFNDSEQSHISESLEKVAEEYRRESYRKSVQPNIDGPTQEHGGSIKDAFIAGAEWQKKQQPTEWSEKDEKMLKYLEEILDYAFKNLSHFEGNAVNALIWLKSLPERFNLQPKQEWSDGAKKALDEISDYLKYKGREEDADFIKHLRPTPKQEWSDSDKLKLRQTLECLEYLSCQGKSDCVSWLKALPERFNFQSSWKPTEEQMYELNIAIRRYAGDFGEAAARPLKDLYEELEKL